MFGENGNNIKKKIIGQTHKTHSPKNKGFPMGGCNGSLTNHYHDLILHNKVRDTSRAHRKESALWKLELVTTTGTSYDLLNIDFVSGI